MKLIQKRGERINEFELVGDYLKIKKKKLLSTKEWQIHLENIGNEISVITYSRKGINIIGLFFLFFAVLAWVGLFVEGNPEGKFDYLIWGSFFFVIMGIVCFKAPMDNILTLYGDNSKVHFFLDQPSREKVEEFVEVLMKNSREFIVEKYTRVDSTITEETMFSRLNWLMDNKYIEESTYEDLKKTYEISKLLN